MDGAFCFQPLPLTEGQIVMKKHLYLFVLLIAITFSCDDTDNTFCISGEVVAYQPCGGYSVIEVDPDRSIGKEIKMGQNTYKNAIQVPGEFTNGRGYFRIREYRESDASLAESDAFCLAIYAPLDIPYYTALDRNDSHCP